MKVKLGKPRCYRWYHHLFKKRRSPRPKTRVKIDPWDTWSVDVTLSTIVLPLLREYKKRMNGHPIQIDDSDIPRYIKSEVFHEDRQQELAWKHIVSQMIRAHEEILEEENLLLYNLGEKLDAESAPIYRERSEQIERGLYLFGKYYQSLWL